MLTQGGKWPDGQLPKPVVWSNCIKMTDVLFQTAALAKQAFLCDLIVCLFWAVHMETDGRV